MKTGIIRNAVNPVSVFRLYNFISPRAAARFPRPAFGIIQPGIFSDDQFLSTSTGYTIECSNLDVSEKRLAVGAEARNLLSLRTVSSRRLAK